MSRRELAREVLDAEEFAEYLATERQTATPTSRTGGLPRVNGDGYDQLGDFHGVPGHWDDQTWRES